jgi:hypothetical protein
MTSFLVGLSPTVYLRQGRPFTHIRWRDPGGGGEMEAWCAWDWTLLPSMFEVSGERLELDMLSVPRVVDLDKLAATPRRVPLPAVPWLDADSFDITRGDPDAVSGRELLAAIRRHVVTHRDTLAAVRAAQARVQAEAAAWKRDHPERPRDRTVILRPHRGSRYLRNDDGKEAR